MSYHPGGQVGGFTDGVGSETVESFSLIDRHSTFEGTLTSSRDLRIEGAMHGTVRCQGLLYVAEGADVDATVEATSVTVAGQLRGDVTCRGKLQIMPSGRVTAAVTTESLVINEGAIIEGKLQMDLGGILGPGEAGGSDSAQSILRRFNPEPSNGSSGALPSNTPRKDGD
jgi:cytoskeletal protein CcmA (bactofilin family)